jgi:NAD-dependent deacetylase
MALKLVVLTGAGISAESGLNTFRGNNGLWEGYKITEVASPTGWANNPQLVLDFYNMRRRDANNAQPNAAHLGLAHLEQYYDVHIITQNVDDLHERAGSHKIWHLHGELNKMRSTRNKEVTFPIYGDILLGDTAPDGGQLRPHIVWFGEEVPMMEVVVPIVEEADIFVIIGTSLQVYPAASLAHNVPNYAPIYILDTQLPEVAFQANIIPIIMPASEGIKELYHHLGVPLKDDA